MDLRLYLVTDSSLSRGRPLPGILDAALRGGVTMVQYREKSATTRQMIEEAGELCALCRAAGVSFIVNDRLDIALAVGADGLHVGQDDMPVRLARVLLGPGKILGVSANNPAEALDAVAGGADYIGASPVFATPTKPDAPKPLELSGLRQVAAAVSVPVVAIGGINAQNAASVIDAGAAGVAVVSAIVGADNVETAARAIRAVVDRAIGR